MPIPDVSDRSLRELVSLQGRTAVVTGGAQGLGRAIARRLAEAGASLVIGDLIEAGARSVADDLAATFGVTALATSLDVADSASIAALADTAVNQLGGIDIWVNNAGIYPSTPTLEMSDDEWDRVVRINLNGTFFGCREAARRMVQGGRGGVIVNLSSVAGIRGRGPRISHYVASKHGIIGLTQQTRTGVRRRWDSGARHRAERHDHPRHRGLAARGPGGSRTGPRRPAGARRPPR